MNSKLIPALTILGFFWASSAYSDPKPLGRSSEHRARREDNGKVDHDLVHRLVQIGREKYEAGNLKAADKILRAALEIEPRNNEAWYYMNLLDETVRKKREQQNTVRPWYPTLPPRPVHE